MTEKTFRQIQGTQKNAEIKNIQTRLKNYLYANQITQRKFARFIGKSEITISRWLSPTGQGLTPANIRLVKNFLSTHHTPPQPLFPHRHSAVFSSAQNMTGLIISRPSGEYIRNLIVRRIVLMDDHATKDKILKMICRLPLDRELQKIMQPDRPETKTIPSGQN